MDDTLRLDALAKHGLCVAQHQTKTEGEWASQWSCNFGIDNSVWAPSIREVIDLAVSVIEIGERDAS